MQETKVRIIVINIILVIIYNRLCGLVVRVLGYRCRGPGFDSRALQSSGSGTGSTQPREYNWGATWKKSSGSCLDKREYGRRDPSRWPRGTFYQQKLAITSPTSGGRGLRPWSFIYIYIVFINRNILMKKYINSTVTNKSI
jgi:hypothetical protein